MSLRFKQAAAVGRTSLIRLMVLALVGVAVLPAQLAADHIVLRDLKVLRNTQVIAFDEDGVKIANHGLIPWSDVQQGTLQGNRQADFDKLHEELGVPLFQIRRRLLVGDYRNLGQPVEAIYERYKDRGNEQAYMVCQAAMWQRLANGDRPAALAAYLRCLGHATAHPKYLKNLTGERRLVYDPETGFAAGLVPLFFDSEKAKQALPEVILAANRLGNKAPHGVFVYVSALAIAAGEWETAQVWRDKVKSSHLDLKEWPDLLSAQQLIAQQEFPAALVDLQSERGNWRPANEAMGRYLLGVSQARTDNPEIIAQGMLDLMYLPAIYAAEHPDLASAALAEAESAMKRLKGSDEAAAFRRRLLFEFGGTYHAELARKATTRNDNS